MACTIEELEKRVTALEGEMARSRSAGTQNGVSHAADPIPSHLRADQAVLSAGVAKAFAAMGIAGKPIGAKKIQELTGNCGNDPEGTEFSQAIIDMREE